MSHNESSLDRYRLPNGTPCSHKSSNSFRLQQSLLILIHLHLLRRRLLSDCLLHRFITEVRSFIENVSCVSQNFYESSFFALKNFIQTNTFSVVSDELPLLSSFTSLFGVEVQSVFLDIDGPFNVVDFHSYSSIISGLEIILDNSTDLAFFNSSSPSFLPHLKQLHVHVERSLLEEFSNALKTHPTLDVVHLPYNFIGNSGVMTLAEALKVNCSIRVIDLRHNYIGDEGAIYLAEALKDNVGIAVINLEHNYIGDEGVAAIARALSVNYTITHLELGYNSIGDDGVLALALGLKDRTLIPSINLRGNISKENRASQTISTT
ncbi:hypothetical protein GEMRC1_010710 [Eukaryota sp. GEM-RC1]